MKTDELNTTQWYARHQLLRSLTQRDWGILWMAGHLWHFAFWVDILVLAWLVLIISDSPLLVGLVGAARMAPMGILGIFFGQLGDRFPKRKLLLVAQVVNTCATVALAVALLLRIETLWLIFVVSLITGCAWAADYPNRRAFIRELVPEGLTLNAMSLDIVSFSAMNLVGKLAAGGMLVLIGPSGVYSVLSVVYLVGLFLLTRISSVSYVKPVREDLWKINMKDMGMAIRYAFSLPALRGVLIVTIIVNFLVFPYMQLAPVFAKDVLDVGPGMLGLMTSAEGFGMMIGAMFLASIGKIERVGVVFIIGTAITTLAVIFFSLSTVYILSLGMVFFAGIGMSGFATMQNVIPVSEASQEMRATALGVIALAIGAHPLGMVYIGALAGSVSAPIAVFVNALIGLGLILIVWKFYTGLKSYST